MSTPGMIGSIDQYQRHKSFANYVERFEILCKLNKVSAETKQSWFISVSGDEVFDEVKLIFPKKEVSEIPYDEMIKKLKARLDKVEPALMNRYEFYNRLQRSNESAENFVLAVKLLAENCNFREFKDEAIRDRLIIGLRDKELRKKLLMDDEVNLETVEKTIISSEKAENRAEHMDDYGESSKVLSVKQRLGRKFSDSDRERDRDRVRNRSWSRDRSRSNERGRNDRYRNRTREWTGDYQQDNRENRFKNFHTSAVCNYCKRKGHIRKNCYFLQNNNRGKTVNFVEKEEIAETSVSDKFDRIRVNDTTEEDSDISCMMIRRINKVTEACLVDVLVEGIKLAMEVDTGSAVAVISEMLYRQSFSSIPISKCDKTLVVVNGSKIAVVGEISVGVILNGISAERRLIVLNTSRDFTPLLGRDWMKVFYPNWKDHFMQPRSVNSLDDTKDTEQVLSTIKQRYSKVFNKDFTEPIAGFEAELTLKSEQPIFKKAYQVPFKIKDKFLEHLNMLENQGVITPIQASEWASPVIAVMKKDGDVRMILIGKHKTNAHRRQLKAVHESKRNRTVVHFPVTANAMNKRRRDSIEDDDDFYGFPEEPTSDRIHERKKAKLVRSPINTRSRAARHS
ncbi:uncharacterized protein LOC134291782 [Aedes albopictus]|uniref:Peptidase A2 domain-containing protein n=1 Tax=Aedes albopictus TaxID=7160 RepID=A0ABM1YCG1_AEDAL